MVLMVLNSVRSTGLEWLTRIEGDETFLVILIVTSLSYSYELNSSTSSAIRASAVGSSGLTYFSFILVYGWVHRPILIAVYPT